MTVVIMQMDGLKDISSDLLMDNGKLKLLPAEYYRNLEWDEFRLFCHKHARYGIPTIELIEYLKEVIGERKAIEIGAGHGDLGYHLDIIRTDSKLQDDPLIKLEYKLMQQPIINYPLDVQKFEALEAIRAYKPKVVIGSWVTSFGDPSKVKYGCNLYGIKEDRLLESVDTYVMIGNLALHGDKPIRSYTHKTILAPWLVSRAKDSSRNCIMIWNKEA